MVQLWVFHVGSLPRDAFGHIKVLWMMGSAQFFWWVIRPDQERLCIKCFWVAKKVYLKCILGLVWSLLMNISLGHKGFKVDLG